MRLERNVVVWHWQNFSFEVKPLPTHLDREFSSFALVGSGKSQYVQREVLVQFPINGCFVLAK